MDQVDQTPLTERQGYWLKHIQACDASGMTMVEYALAHDINVKGLYSGKEILVRNGVLPRAQRPSRFQRTKQQTRFQRVKITDLSRDHSFRVQLPNGVCVVLSGVVDSDSLKDVLMAAAAIE